jgi:hypothetical protein
MVICYSFENGTKAGAPFADAGKFFIPIWFYLSASNLWIGVKQAGYSFAEELPIFLLTSPFPPVPLRSCGGDPSGSHRND